MVRRIPKKTIKPISSPDAKRFKANDEPVIGRKNQRTQNMLKNMRDASKSPNGNKENVVKKDTALIVKECDSSSSNAKICAADNCWDYYTTSNQENRPKLFLSRNFRKSEGPIYKRKATKQKELATTLVRTRTDAMIREKCLPFFTVEYTRINGWVNGGEVPDEFTSCAILNSIVYLFKKDGSVSEIDYGFARIPIFKSVEDELEKTEGDCYTLRLRPFSCSKKDILDTESVFLFVKATRWIKKSLNCGNGSRSRRAVTVLPKKGAAPAAPPKPEDYEKIVKFGCRKIGYTLDNDSLHLEAAVQSITLIDHETAENEMGVSIEDLTWMKNLAKAKELNEWNDDRKSHNIFLSRLLFSMVDTRIQFKERPKGAPIQKKIEVAKVEKKFDGPIVKFEYVGQGIAKNTMGPVEIERKDYRCPFSNCKFRSSSELLRFLNRRYLTIFDFKIVNESDKIIHVTVEAKNLRPEIKDFVFKRVFEAKPFFVLEQEHQLPEYLREPSPRFPRIMPYDHPKYAFKIDGDKTNMEKLSRTVMQSQELFQISLLREAKKAGSDPHLAAYNYMMQKTMFENGYRQCSRSQYSHFLLLKLIYEKNGEIRENKKLKRIYIRHVTESRVANLITLPHFRELMDVVFPGQNIAPVKVVQQTEETAADEPST